MVALCSKPTIRPTHSLSRCALSSASFLRVTPALQRIETPAYFLQFLEHREPAHRQLAGLRRQMWFLCGLNTGASRVANARAGALQGRSDKSLRARARSVIDFASERPHFDEHRDFVAFDVQTRFVAFEAVERFSSSAECARDSYYDADRWVEPLIGFDLIQRRMVHFSASRELVLRPAQRAASCRDPFSQRHASGL